MPKNRRAPGATLTTMYLNTDTRKILAFLKDEYTKQHGFQIYNVDIVQLAVHYLYKNNITMCDLLLD